MRVFLLPIFICTLQAAKGDWVPYQEQREIQVTNANLLVVHRHNWSDPKVQLLLSNSTNADSVFTPANYFSKLVVIDTDSLQVLFTTPCPALTHIWLSKDSHYLIGLSSVKFCNPYQLVIWDLLTKKLIWKERIAGNHPYSGNISESVSNWIWWFDTSDVHLIVKQGVLDLTLLDPQKEPFVIHIPVQDTPQTPKAGDKSPRVYTLPDAYSGSNQPVEFEGVVIERLPSMQVWAGWLPSYQGIKYDVNRVISGPITNGIHIVQHLLVGPPLCESNTRVLSSNIFKLGQTLHLKAELTPDGQYVGGEQADAAHIIDQ